MGNIDEEIELLKVEIKRLGITPSSTGEGIASVKFGVLVRDEKVSNIFEALVNVLRSAKKKGIVSYKSEMLMQGLNDQEDIVLLK